MKVRTDFVTNSSSSSFIVEAKDKELAERKGLELVPVKELISQLEVYEKLAKTEVSSWVGMGFLFEELRLPTEIKYLNELREIEAKNPGSYLSHPYDKDQAYDQNINFEEFEGDL